jgi:hypothetical protein
MKSQTRFLQHPGSAHHLLHHQGQELVLRLAQGRPDIVLPRLPRTLHHAPRISLQVLIRRDIPSSIVLADPVVGRSADIGYPVLQPRHHYRPVSYPSVGPLAFVRAK